MSFLRKAAVLAVLVCALGAASAAIAAPIGVYQNPMSNDAQREALRKLDGESCKRGGSEDALRITLGKRTSECSYRTPVIGRDLEIGATARLLSGTPKALRKQAFLALDLRAGEDGAPLPARGLPAAAQGPAPRQPPRRQLRIPEDRQGRRRDQGGQRTERTAAARLQRHQRPGQRLLPSARLRRQRTRGRRDRRCGRRTAGARLLGRARGLEVGQGPGRELRRPRRPGSEPVRIVTP